MKKVVLFTFACLFMLGNQVYAHTGLESSNPDNRSTVTEEIDMISLTFETKIEQTSSFELQDANGETVSVNDLSVSDNTMTGSVTETLENGDYQVLWKIIGVDGHPIEGEFSFTVDVPTSESASEDTESLDPETTDNPEADEPTEQTETDAAKNPEESSNNTIIGIIIVLVVVLTGSVWWMMRRKK